MTSVRRDVARALLFDADGRLVLIRRVRIGTAPYLVTPGGGVEPGEDTAATATRECAEEVGARVIVGPVALVSPPHPEGVATYHVAIVDAWDESLRTGHELSEPQRGSYETVRIRWDDTEALAGLGPPGLADLVAVHGPTWAAWAAEAYGASADRSPA